MRHGLTHNERNIVDYLKDKDWVSPTQIGHDVGGRIESLYGNRYRHSAWASPICKRLVEKGVLERNDKGRYRLVHNEVSNG